MSSSATASLLNGRWLAIAVTALLLSGCGLMSHNGHPQRASGGEGKPLGERPGSVPAAAKGGGGASPSPTPRGAILRFAELYSNWTYKTLAAHERKLASLAIGAARLAEQQAAAQTAGDSTIARAHIYNRGRVLAIAPLIGAEKNRYAVVTREETGGTPEYAGLAASYHVTLATVVRVRKGFALSAWEPAS